jgi:hypothetical protein
MRIGTEEKSNAPFAKSKYGHKIALRPSFDFYLSKLYNMAVVYSII